MKTKAMGRIAVAALLLAGGAVAKTNNNTGPRTDQQIAESVRHEIAMYPRYTIFDDLGFSVIDGQVTLSGDVVMPVEKTDMGRIVAKVPGVTSVTNNINVLPLSDFDNRLRAQIARAVFSAPNLNRYAMMPMPTIHIIVDNGHVTLVGTVASDMDKQIAGMRANGAGLSFGPVVNNLVVENPARKS
jgi:hyperosmotically inducible periplasmic protein